MRAYILVSGIIFALILVAHLLRLSSEGMWHLREPDFLLSSLAVLAMLGWSIFLLVRRGS